MRIANPTARAFYEIEAVREAWSTRQLERQIIAATYRSCLPAEAELERGREEAERVLRLTASSAVPGGEP